MLRVGRLELPKHKAANLTNRLKLANPCSFSDCPVSDSSSQYSQLTKLLYLLDTRTFEMVRLGAYSVT